MVTVAASRPHPRVVALLAEIRRMGSLRKASHALGIAPGNAHRLLRNAERRVGARLIVGSAGGARGGGSRLTPTGRKFAELRQGISPPATTWWPCRLADPATRRSPVRLVVPEAGVTASVAPIGASWKWTSGLGQGSDLELGIVPEALTIVRRNTKVSGSARNLWPARVVRLRGPVQFGVQFVDLQVGRSPIAASVTSSAVSELRLKPGLRVKVLVKATALRLRLRLKP